MPRSSSSSPAPVAISLSHATTTTTPTTTVTFYTNALDEKHKLNKPQTVEFPSALLTAKYALSLLPNIALLQPDARFSAYDNLELAKLRLGADAAVHLTIVRWHLLGSSPTADEKKSMVERQRVVCGCDNPSYLQCRIRAYAAIQRRGGKPDVRCTRFQKLPVSVTSSPTLLDLMLDAIEEEPNADLLDVAKRIQASYPEISAVHEIRFNQGAAIEYNITRVSDKDDAERSTKQKPTDNSWVNREMLWRIDSNRALITAFDKELAKEVDFITACPGNVYQVNWRNVKNSADKVTHDSLVLLGWTDKVFRDDKAATHLGVGTYVTIDGEVGEIVKKQKERGARGKLVFDVKVADKVRVKVERSKLKPAVYEVQELVNGLVDTVVDDGVKQSLQRVRLLLRTLLPTLPIVAVVREEAKEAGPADDDETEENEEVEEEEEVEGEKKRKEREEDSGEQEGDEDEDDKEDEDEGSDGVKAHDEKEEMQDDGKEEKQMDEEKAREQTNDTHQEERKEGHDTDGDGDDQVEEKQRTASDTAAASDNDTRKVKQVKRKTPPSTTTTLKPGKKRVGR